MKTQIRRSMLALAGALLLLGSQQAHAIRLDFSNVAGANITFTGTGDTFSFVDNTTVAGSGLNKDFQITNEAGGTNAALGLFGKIDGTFTIGAITVNGTRQSATVTSSGGVFSITDGAAQVFTATINWIDIFTDTSTGGTNSGGAVNITGITYSGTNADLLALKGSTSTASATVSFQFIPAMTLTQLTTDGQVNSTSYSGSVTSVPDGGLTVALLGIGLVALEAMRRRMKVA